MKRIKAMNGYTIYQLTARDEKNGEGFEGEYAVYFSSDIREYGREYSYAQWDGLGSLEEAESYCTDEENVLYCKAREACEAESTAVTFEDIEEKLEEMKQEQEAQTEDSDDIRYLIQATFTAQKDTPTHKAGETSIILYGKEGRSEKAPACAWFIEEYGYKRESDARRIMQRQYIDDSDDTEWWSISYELVRVSISETLEAVRRESERRKYEIYREMMDEIPALEERIRESLEARGYTVYTVFLAVSREEYRWFTTDIEYGDGNPDHYRRIRWNDATAERLLQWFPLLQAYRVSFQVSETTYCSNIARASSREAVAQHYSKYPWFSISEATDGDLKEAERKGMPVIDIEQE